jgi:hypothetical protein
MKATQVTCSPIGRYVTLVLYTVSINDHKHILYHALRMEVERLREAAAQLNVNTRNRKRVFIPASNGPAPPDDLDDADGMMDWLDGRGIISAQWAKIKEMMERAHKLEAKGRGTEDEIELG